MKPGRFLRNANFQPDSQETGKSSGHREQIAADITRKYGHVGDLLDIFVQTSGAGVDKWNHYLPLYEHYFAPCRHKPVKLLEIGVLKGGSLEMWRKYFGPEATIYGIDINPACARFDGHAGQVRIGSQADPEFLNAVVDEMGGVDIVLDDGSHVMAHIRTSLATLFPRLSTGGVYMIEDLHTAYWKHYGGGAVAPENFFNDVRAMIDDMHDWYHGCGAVFDATANGFSGIHIHDSILVLDKGVKYRPVWSLVGSDTGKTDGSAPSLGVGTSK